MPEPIAPARLSASILLVRDDPDLQVFMARRHHKIDFAGGALVFPGGKASKDDARAGWAERIDGTAGALTVFAVAAVRETFEECGLLLCRPESARGAGNPLAGADVAAALAPHRAAVDRGEASFLDLVTDAGLVLALDRLAHFAHLITPEFNTGRRARPLGRRDRDDPVPDPNEPRGAGKGVKCRGGPRPGSQAARGQRDAGDRDRRCRQGMADDPGGCGLRYLPRAFGQRASAGGAVEATLSPRLTA